MTKKRAKYRTIRRKSDHDENISSEGIRIVFSLQPWHLILCTILGIVLVLLLGIGVYHYNYEKQMVLYEQQLKYESQIGMYKKQMKEEKLEYERRITEHEQWIATINKQLTECSRQRTKHKEQMDSMEEEKLEYERRATEYEQWVAIINKELIECRRQITKHKEQMVISYQKNVINIFKLGVCKVQESTDHYVAQLKKYCELKDRWSLSSQEEDELSQLEEDFQLEPDQTLDVHSATSAVRQVSKETSNSLSSRVKELEDALHEMDIEKMRQLQKFMNKKYLDAFFKKQMEEIKIKLAKSSEELKQRGLLYRISLVLYDRFMPTFTHIVVSVATNVIKNMMF